MLQLSVTSSSFLQEVTAANKLFQSASVFVDTPTSKQKATCTFHPLTKQEIEALKQNHNTAENWNQILKLSDRTLRTDRIQCCSLHGFVVFGTFLSVLTYTTEFILLGNFENTCEMIDRVHFPCGCYNSAISHSIILDDALIRDTILLHHTLVHSKAIVIRCGIVGNESGPKTYGNTFGNGLRINLGAETGGRHVTIVADLTFECKCVARSIE